MPAPTQQAMLMVDTAASGGARQFIVTGTSAGTNAVNSAGVRQYMTPVGVVIQET